MKALTTRTVLILAFLFSVAVLPASANHILEAEISCDGIYAPGDRIPVELSFENHTNVPMTVDYSVSLTLPNGRDRALLDRSLTLQPDQNRELRMAIHLPRQAPLGHYVMTLDATGSEIVSDTCSFRLQ